MLKMQEAVFLYDMLNNKHAQLKNTAVEVDHMIKSSRQAGATAVAVATVAAKNETANNGTYADKTYADKRNTDGTLIDREDTGSNSVSVKQDYTTAQDFEPIHPQRVVTKEKSPVRQADTEKERTVKNRENQSTTGKMNSAKEQSDLQQIQTAAKQVPIKINKRKNGAVEITFDTDQTKSGNNNEKILNLHKAGKSNMAIAKELGLGIGEVKLVIDLFEGI